MKIKNLTLMLLVFVTVVGCKKQIEIPDGTDLKQISTQGSNPRNPYSLTSMRKAFTTILIGDVQLINGNQTKYAKGKVMFADKAQSLSINKQMTAKEGTAIAENSINVSHYYIKFMPRNDKDYDKLKADSNLITYPFPLDNEISQYSGSYRDPQVPKGIPTYQYAAVPVNYILPNVPYQKIDDLFIPNEKPNNTVSTKAAGGSSFSVSARVLADQAECEAQTTRLALDGDGGLEDDCGNGGGGGGGGGGYPPSDPYRNGEDWRPNGRLTVYDEVKQQVVGVEGIKVRARRWFTTYEGFSDANGYYAVDGWYTRPANYWLDFERYEFSVNDHGGGPREIGGPKIEAAWNVQFDGYDKFCSTIFRGAYHYYYKDIQGLRRPPQNSFWNTQMKLGAYNYFNSDATASHSPARRFLGIGEAIHVYNPDRRIDDIYATTIHELAHAVHWELDKNAYFVSTTNISESWSVGVQWVLTKMEYPDYFGRPNGTIDYTNVVMDLLDPPGVVYHQFFPNGTFYQYGQGAPVDQVGYYSITQIEQSLVGTTDFNSWKSNLIYRYDNITDQHLDALFNFWANS